MIIDKECGFYNEEKGDEYAPERCDDCYRFNICKEAFLKEVDEKYQPVIDKGKIFNTIPVDVNDEKSFKKFLVDMSVYIKLKGINSISLHVNIHPVFDEYPMIKHIEKLINEVIESEGWNSEDFFTDNISFNINRKEDFDGDIINEVPIDEEIDPQKLHEIFTERVVNMARDLGISCFVATSRTSGSIIIDNSDMVEYLTKDYDRHKRLIQHVEEDDINIPSFLDMYYVFTDCVRNWKKGNWCTTEIHKLGKGKSGNEYCFCISGEVTAIIPSIKRRKARQTIDNPFIYLYWVDPCSQRPVKFLKFMYVAIPHSSISNSIFRIFLDTEDYIYNNPFNPPYFDVNMYDPIFEDVNERTEESWYNKVAKYIHVNDPHEFMMDFARDLSYLISERF